MPWRSPLLLLLSWVISCSTVFAAVDFEQHIVPILETHCLSCHDADHHKGDLRLDFRKHALESIKPGDPDRSSLIEQISGPEPEMPKKASPLKPEQIQLLRTWIAEGAHWPNDRELKDNPPRNLNWWSLQPLLTDTLIETENIKRHPIDRYVDAALVKKGLKPVAPADSISLLRRITYDLTGLPPTTDDINGFTLATYEQTVDRLLNSPAFGEHWARHWLDVARYGETHGYDKDKLRNNAWPYRDYVIRAFNEDKPYDRFVQEQIAGDALFPNQPDGIIALGFLAAGPWDFIGHVEVGETKIDGRIAKHLDRDEMISAVYNVFVSTTVQCAQCHHHKFDPVRMEDYYRLHAVFADIDRADRMYAPPTPAQIAERKKLTDRLTELRNERKQFLLSVKKLTPVAEVTTETADFKEKEPKLTSEQAARLKDIDKNLAGVNKRIVAFPAGKMVYAAANQFTTDAKFTATGGVARPIHLLKRGDINRPSDVMHPGMVPLWLSATSEFELKTEHKPAEARAALAIAITAPDNLLLWRSIVNRLWLWTFSKPLVGTPNDFGQMGMMPTNQALLDYLAIRLRDDPKHSLKSIIRLLVTSEAYRRSSTFDKTNAQIDADNTFLWRANRRRLTAEEIRDSLLAISGQLRLDARYGPSFQDFVIQKPQHSPHYEYHLYDPYNSASYRRSIYRFVVRSQPQPFLTTFDCADPSLSVAGRDESTTALQALVQWNNHFVEAMSVHLANRLETMPGDKIINACRLALGREPQKLEHEVLTQFQQQYGTASLGRVIYNLNAFMYVD